MGKVKTNWSQNELAKYITNLIFAEKETILAAYDSKDEDMLEDEIYEYIQNCG